MRLSYHYQGGLYTDKMVSLYWDRPQTPKSKALVFGRLYILGIIHKILIL